MFDNEDEKILDKQCEDDDDYDHCHKIFRKLESAIAEIETQVARIDTAIFSPSFGLKEIKEEVRKIEKEVHEVLKELCIKSYTMTTGPAVRDVDVYSLATKILNNTGRPIEITVKLYNIDKCEKCLINCKTFEIDSKCSKYFVFGPVPGSFEVQFTPVAQDVFVWVGGGAEGKDATIASSHFIDANTFKHSDMVYTYDICN